MVFGLQNLRHLKDYRQAAMPPMPFLSSRHPLDSVTRNGSKAEQASKPSLPPHGRDENSVKEVVNHDDLSALCHALLYKPVKTQCNHTMCESCLTLWAEISIDQQMAIVGLDDQPMTLHPSQLEIKCCLSSDVPTARSRGTDGS